MQEKIITVAVIAHVDHGKTTLVDELLKQGGAFQSHEETGALMMDSNDQERERGITILSKNCSIKHGDMKINIVDTPGHADFSSEVERVLKVVDTVLLLVDAQEGPMPQTRFVLQKSLELGLRPILVINKIDKDAAQPERVVDDTFDLFSELGASNEQLDFPIVYAIAREGIAKKNMSDESSNLDPMFDIIKENTTTEKIKSADEPLQALIYSLEYDDYLGRIGIGRVMRGKVKTGTQIALARRDGSIVKGKISKMFVYEGMKKKMVTEAEAGEIVGIAGFSDITIGETFTDIEKPEALDVIEIGEPTVSMYFSPNTSPFTGQEGKLVTTRQIRERLFRELETNVGLKVEEVEGDDSYKVSGRGELHLAVLIESMRREGFELSVSRPTVIMHEDENGKKTEPIEMVVTTVPDEYAGAIIEKLGKRKGEMKNMHSHEGFTNIEFEIPTRGLIGYSSEFIRDTRGEGNLNHLFLRYEPWKGAIASRMNGVLISGVRGKAMGYDLDNLQDRGVLFIPANTEVYEGMIIGENAKTGDLTVNPTKGKKLTNVRSSGTDDALKLIPPRSMNLEQAIEFIADDELVEVTPSAIRLRKKLLTELERKRKK